MAYASNVQHILDSLLPCCHLKTIYSVKCLIKGVNVHKCIVCVDCVQYLVELWPLLIAGYMLSAKEMSSVHSSGSILPRGITATDLLNV